MTEDQETQVADTFQLPKPTQWVIILHGKHDHGDLNTFYRSVEDIKALLVTAGFEQTYGIASHNAEFDNVVIVKNEQAPPQLRERSPIEGMIPYDGLEN